MDKKKIFTILENGVNTDKTYDVDNKLKIYAALYNPLTAEFLGYVEDKEEWKDIINILDNVLM